MVRPFAEAMRRYGKNPDPVLATSGLDWEQLTDDTVIAAQTWYGFVEAATEAVSDRYFGYRAGSEPPVEQLPNVQPVQLRDVTLGEVFTALIVDAGRISTLATYDLTIRANTTRLVSTRTFKPVRPPAQIDGFFVSFLLNIIRRCVPGSWRPSEMVVSVSDPDAFPPEAHRELTILKGNDAGTLVQFPTRWLLSRTNRRNQQADIGTEVLEWDFTERLRGLIALRLSDPNLSIKMLARLTYISVSSLQARLKADGTTYLNELKTLRSNRAEEMLRSSSQSIADVGKAVGYRDLTAFSRAFKSWTDITPREFRRNSQYK
jgi:AraC-like DNA-binding protein